MMPMLVVSDASPLNILVRLGQISVLASLFKTVVVPASVADEMSRAATPPLVRDWIAQPPSWLSVRTPASGVRECTLRHRGERDAIRLAQELRADAILLDEDKPRAQATKLGLRVVGTIGVLEQAANRGLIADLRAVHDQLRETDFYISDEILNASLARHLAYKQAKTATR
jgi:predicted nucleic acid-binding protein